MIHGLPLKPRDFIKGNALAAVAAILERTPSALTVFVVLLLATLQLSAVEHPGILPKDSECTDCHADKTRGKSVHSAMAISCTVCHLVRTQGDMTTVDLALPKEQICFACHEKSPELQQHKPVVKEDCTDCHDTHSSNRRMLLRKHVEASPSPRALTSAQGKRKPQGGRPHDALRGISVSASDCKGLSQKAADRQNVLKSVSRCSAIPSTEPS